MGWDNMDGVAGGNVRAVPARGYIPYCVFRCMFAKGEVARWVYLRRLTGLVQLVRSLL